MNCCSRNVGSAERFFGLMSWFYERRYRRKGLDDGQRMLVKQLAELGFKDNTVLEVGCGVGVFHQTLLEQGAASACAIDLAPRMLELARQRAHDRGLADRVNYHQGDFVEVQHLIDTADLTVMDKVVCCYPAPKELLDAAVNRTRRLIALTYPRKHLAGIVWNGIWNAGLWLLRSDFRVFVHDPETLHHWLEKRGLQRVFDHQTLFWHARIYQLKP